MQLFAYGSGGLYIAMQTGCSNSVTTLISGGASQEEDKQVLPDGAIPLEIQTASGEPVGVLHQGEEILLCVGMNKFQLLNLRLQGNTVGLGSKISDMYPKTPEEIITEVGITDEGELAICADGTGSVVIPIDGQQIMADAMSCAMQAQQDDSVAMVVKAEDVPYEARIENPELEQLYNGASLILDTIPLKGTCGVEFLRIPNPKVEENEES